MWGSSEEIIVKDDPRVLPKKTRSPKFGPPWERRSKSEPKITFSRFSREISTFQKNLKLPKIFCIKFSTKMVLMKIVVAIVLTNLQRFESRANVKETYDDARPEISRPERDLEARI